MSTTIFACGAECGVTAIGTSALSTNGRHLSTMGATTTVVANTEPAGLDMPGSWTWKFNPSAGATDTWAHLFPTAIASGGTMVVRFKLQFRVLPNGIRTICSSQAGLNGIRYNPTGTKLEAWAGSATATFAGSFVPSVDTIYHVECKFVRGTTHTTDWRIDGADQTQASKGSQSAATQTGVNFGTNGTGSGGNANATATYYIDDILVSGTSADYDDAAFTDTTATVVGLYPSADGTHSFTDNDFAWPAAANAKAHTATDAWTALHNTSEGLTSTISDFISQIVIRNTGYVEFAFDDMPNADSVAGIEILSETHGSTTGAHTQSLVGEDAAIETVVFQNADSSDITVSYNSKHYATTPSSSFNSAWTKTDVDAFIMRWGFSTDVTGNPILDGLCLEVDYIPATAGGVTLDGHGDAASAGVADALLAADLQAHGDAATAGRADALLAADLQAHGDAATTARADLLLTADLQGHADASTTGVADITVSAGGNAVVLEGHGDAATTGSADLLLGADLQGHGDASTTGTADALLAADLQGHGDASTAGRADALLGADLAGHGDAASGATADIVIQGAIDLAGGHGDACTAGVADLIVTVALAGHADASTAGVAAVLAALDLQGHGDAATTATADVATGVAEAIAAAESNYAGRRRNRILTITVTFVYPTRLEVTAEITAQARTRCPRGTQTRAEITNTHPIALQPRSVHRYRVMSEADRLRDDLEAITALLQHR